MSASQYNSRITMQKLIACAYVDAQSNCYALSLFGIVYWTEATHRILIKFSHRFFSPSELSRGREVIKGEMCSMVSRGHCSTVH